MKFILRNFVLLWMLIIGMNACRSHKKTTDVDRNMPSHTETGFYTSCYPITSLYVPSCKLEISNGNQSFSLNGSVYIRPDSICFFRGRFVVEAVRGVIYRDSFVMVNYLERVCYKGKNDYLQRVTGYPVNPESLMLLFTADRCEEAWRNKFNFIATAGSSDKILMQGANRSLLEMHINTNDRTLEDVALYQSRQRQALFSAAYSGYEQFPQFAMPTVFDISAHDGNNLIHIKANFRQILLNQPQKADTGVPVSASYKIVVLK